TPPASVSSQYTLVGLLNAGERARSPPGWREAAVDDGSMVKDRSPQWPKDLGWPAELEHLVRLGAGRAGEAARRRATGPGLQPEVPPGLGRGDAAARGADQ